MQAALPMYFPPEGTVPAFWSALAGLLRSDAACAGLAIPETLQAPPELLAHWLQPDLLLSQTCGFPLSTRLRDQVQVVGTFAYDAPGVDGIYCRSQLVCRRDDPRPDWTAFAGARLAYNDTQSQSGYNALRALVAKAPEPRPFFAATLHTGAHYQSLAAVHSGRADLAAVDAVTWVHAQRSHPHWAAELRVVGETAPYPGLPLITARQTPQVVLQALRRALYALATEPAWAAVCAPLLIRGFVPTTLADYQVCLAMQAEGAASGLGS